MSDPLDAVYERYAKEASTALGELRTYVRDRHSSGCIGGETATAILEHWDVVASRVAVMWRLYDETREED